MDANLRIIAVIVVFFCFYAFFLELREKNHSYIKGKASSNDDVKKSLRKIDICLSYDLKTIKWRRCFLATIIIMVLLFVFVKDSEITPKNVLLYFTVIFTVMYISWRNYAKITGEDVYRIGRENIDRLLTTINK